MSAALHMVVDEDAPRRGGRPREPMSLAGRLREFFDANPDEELGFADIAAKFSISRQVAYNVVRQLEQQGHVESVTVVRGRAHRRENAS